MVVMVDTARNTLPRIDNIWAVLSVDEGGEGVVAAPIQEGMLTVPLIAADEARLEGILQVAHALAKMTGKRMKLVRFSSRHEVKDILP